MKWQEVKDLFRDNVGDVSYVELFNDENEKPRGCGILEFASEDLAKNAVDKMHRYEYKGRKLVVKEDFETWTWEGIAWTRTPNGTWKS